MFEVYRSHQSPLEGAQGPDAGLDRFAAALSSLTLDGARASWSHDRNGPSFRCVHVNAGVKTVEVNSFADGDRFLVPLVPVEQWPADLNSIGHIFKASIRLAVEFASANEETYGSGTEIKIYCPAVVRNDVRNTAAEMLREQLAVTLREMNLTDMEFPLQVITRGPDIQL